MFNARAFATGRSAMHFAHCGEFLLIAAIIFGGQLLIVEFGYGFFNVVPLKAVDWAIIIGSTSLVMFAGEAWRFFRRLSRSGHHG